MWIAKVTLPQEDIIGLTNQVARLMNLGPKNSSSSGDVLSQIVSSPIRCLFPLQYLSKSMEKLVPPSLSLDVGLSLFCHSDDLPITRSESRQGRAQRRTIVLAVENGWEGAAQRSWRPWKVHRPMMIVDHKDLMGLCWVHVNITKLPFSEAIPFCQHLPTNRIVPPQGIWTQQILRGGIWSLSTHLHGPSS